MSRLCHRQWVQLGGTGRMDEADESLGRWGSLCRSDMMGYRAAKSEI